MYVMSSGDESYAEPMSTYMLEDICNGSQSHPSKNRRAARYKIRDGIKRGQSKWKGALLSMQNMGKYIHKVFKAVANKISTSFTNIG